MQAFSPFNPVGTQHNYPSAFSGLRQIAAKEGVKGLTRGVDAAMLRTAMGSSAQLPAYNLAKVKLGEWGAPEGAATYLLASTFSGACVCAVMQPAGTFPLRHGAELTIGRHGADENVQPIAQLDRSGRETSRPALQEPDRLSVQDVEGRGRTRLVQGHHGTFIPNRSSYRMSSIR